MRENLEEHFDEAVYESLHLWIRLCLVIYVGFLLIEPFTIPPELLSTNLLLRFWSAGLTALGLYLFHRFEPRIQWAHPIAATLGFWVFLVSILDFYFIADPFFDLYIQLVLASTGMVALRYSYYALVTLTLVGGWFATRIWLESPPSLEKCLLVAVAVLIGFQTLRLRRQIMVDQWQNRREEMAERKQLAQALREARESQAILDLEVENRSSDLSEALEGLIYSRTQREKLHRHLLHANRIAAVGRLAGGLAHRLNNQLMVFLGSLDCLSASEPGSERQFLIDELAKAGARGANLTEQLMPLTGKKLLRPKTVSVEALLTEFGTLLGKTEGDFEILNRAPQSSVTVDPNAWFQIFQNLIRNADQANLGQGQVTFSVEQHGDQVIFSVDDEGPGISPKIRARIFEPFFTTREDNGGTGLGLSIVLGLVEQMRGHLSCSTLPDGGSRFSVAFDTKERQPSSPRKSVGNLAGLKLSGRVLVAEDDPTVRRLLQIQLEALGLRTVAAENGNAALELFRTDTFDLIVTDVVMPEMDGPELIRMVRRESPDTKVLFTSGYSDARLQEAGVDLAQVGFLPKPYNRQVLEEAVREVLNS